MQVKCFRGNGSGLVGFDKEIEKEVNAWLSTQNIEIIDIKLAGARYDYLLMVFYTEKNN